MFDRLRGNIHNMPLWKSMYSWINDIEDYTIEIITINLRMTLHGGCYNVRFDIWVKYEKQVFAVFFFLQRHVN